MEQPLKSLYRYKKGLLTKLIFYFIQLLFLVPIVLVFIKACLFFLDGGEKFFQLAPLIAELTGNTLIVTGLVLVFSFVIAVPFAFYVVNYDFIGRSFCRLFLILPIVFPSYILAVNYDYVFRVGGMLSMFQMQTSPMFNVIFILTIVVIPYVYLISYNIFMEHKASLLHGLLLKKSVFNIVKKVIIPLAMPSFTFIAVIVMIESFSDFGVSQYFGVNTLTVMIYKYYFLVGEDNFSMFLSVLFLIPTIIFLSTNYRLRKKVGDLSYDNNHFLEERSLTRNLLVLGLALIISVVIFWIPLAQIMLLLLQNMNLLYSDVKLFQSLGNTIFLALVSAVMTIMMSLYIAEYKYQFRNLEKRNYWMTLLSSAYAFPSTILALALIMSFGWLERFVFFSGISKSFMLSGTVIALIIAYIIRFSILSYNHLINGYNLIPEGLVCLEKQYPRSIVIEMIKIRLPWLSKELLVVLLLVMLEVIKELPLTLIIRPFNFDSLMTRVYILTSDERVVEALINSVPLVLLSTLSIFLVMNRLSQVK